MYLRKPKAAVFLRFAELSLFCSHCQELTPANNISQAPTPGSFCRGKALIDGRVRGGRCKSQVILPHPLPCLCLLWLLTRAISGSHWNASSWSLAPSSWTLVPIAVCGIKEAVAHLCNDSPTLWALQLFPYLTGVLCMWTLPLN